MATYKNQKTYDISPTSGDTEKDGVNAHVAKVDIDALNRVKALTGQGRHVEAQKLYESKIKLP
tara:strand:+ start:197 stop:385 length:189 start_codon:yes stop_codon:yes gene_type:complete